MWLTLATIIEYSYVNVTIKNQPLVFDYNNTHLLGAFGFYYNIQIKNHDETSGWVDIYSAYEDDYPTPSDSDYTNISISVEGQMGVGILAATQTDIQVQAMIGDIGREAVSIEGANWLFRGCFMVKPAIGAIRKQ